LSFEVVQSYDEAGNPIAGSLDVIVPELAGQPTYFWDFGDEGTSTDASPSHTYAGNGPYLLCLTATWGENTICTATYCDSVSVDEDGMINFADGFTIHVNPTGNTNAVENAPTTMETPVFPNPVSEGEAIRWTAVCGAGEQLDVFTHTGQLVEEIPAARTSVLSTANWDAGVYVLRWTCPSGAIRTSRLIVQ
jgi:PKD repeat protein